MSNESFWLLGLTSSFISIPAFLFPWPALQSDWSYSFVFCWSALQSHFLYLQSDFYHLQSDCWYPACCIQLSHPYIQRSSLYNNSHLSLPKPLENMFLEQNSIDQVGFWYWNMVSRVYCGFFFVFFSFFSSSFILLHCTHKYKKHTLHNDNFKKNDLLRFFF